MLWKKDDRNKNYNLIIIPEHGGRSKAINLPTVFLKAAALSFIIISLILITLIFIFFRNYSFLRKDISSIKEKQTYIKNLEDENREKQKQLDDYKSVESKINDKLNELQELQDNIKGKLNGSDSSINSTSSTKPISRGTAPATYELKQTLLTELDSKIISLKNMDNQLDSYIEKEKYIPTILPNGGRISSPFGARANPFNLRASDFHPGMDIASDYGSKIYASAKGTVTRAGSYSGYGNAIVIDHHNSLETVYGHTSHIYVEVGQEVEKGQLIGLVGSTGHSTGPHVHFEVRKNGTAVNPMDYIKGGK